MKRAGCWDLVLTEFSQNIAKKHELLVKNDISLQIT